MASYRKMYDAYTRIFARCGLQAFPVEADTGVIGGNYSHEFMVPAETGENEVVYCESGKYAANIEKATSRGPLVPTPTVSTGAAPEKFATPGRGDHRRPAAAPYGVPAVAQIKTLVYIADGKPVISWSGAMTSSTRPSWLASLGCHGLPCRHGRGIVAAMGAKSGQPGRGHRHPKDGRSASSRMNSCAARGMTTGANEDGFHLRHVEVDRDIRVDVWADLRTVRSVSSAWSGPTAEDPRAIEVGHVFKLGTKYSEKLESSFLDEDGQRVRR
jgi:prolyl-tRNA synthetase